MKQLDELKKYRETSHDVLAKQITEEKKKLAESYLRVRAGKLDNFSQIVKLRKNVARMYTIINQQESRGE